MNAFQFGVDGGSHENYRGDPIRVKGRNLRYELPAHSGAMLVQVQTSRGSQNFRVNGAVR